VTAGPVEGAEPAWMPAIRLLEGAYADKTIRESIKCFGLFGRWCAPRGLCAFPASVDAIAGYVTDMFERYARARLTASYPSSGGCT
jgi:hypothetical protein